MSEIEKMLQDFLSHARSDGEFLILDTETTGFGREKDRILSLSAIKATFDLERFEFIETARMDQYMNPERSIPKKASDVNHITYDRIKDEPTEDEAKFIIAPFLGSNPFVIGQNVSFDIDMIQSMATRCEFKFEPSNVVDTMKLARKMIGSRSENHKLATLIRFFDIKQDDIKFHESISDVIATGRVMAKFVMLYQDKLDIEKVAADYAKREAEFTPVEEKEVPFDNAAWADTKDMVRPEVTGMSFWKKFQNKRVYINVTNPSLKIWHDLIKGTWEYKYTDGFGPAVDMVYVKTVTGEMLYRPEYKYLLDIVTEEKEKRKAGNN